MNPHIHKPLMAFFVLALLAVAQKSTSADKTVLRGWLSDESCARGRAQDGAYTQTNPRCAKECVAKGKRIVLIDPDQKRVLVIANQGAAKQNIGDLVEITGEVDAQARKLQIVYLKMIEKGRAMCDVPKKTK
jgi:hypothetical protein